VAASAFAVIARAAADRGLPVRCQPVLPLEAVFGGAEAGAEIRPFPLNAPGVVLTYSGTAALYQAFRALALPPGSIVLCPSYNCGHEIEPLLRLGLGVECYRVTRDLKIDLEDLERRMRGARAVMVTHYFGFPQPLRTLREVCTRHGVWLVEDCAHAFFSDNEEGDLGRVGDAAVYSMRKTLPLPNGGAFVLNNPVLRQAHGRLHEPPRLSTGLKALELAAKAAADRVAADRDLRNLLWLLGLLPLLFGARVIKALHPRARVSCYNPDDEDRGFSTEIMQWGISRFSTRLLERLDLREIVARRRENYAFLAAELASGALCRPLLPALPPRVCPLYMPVWAERPLDLYAKLERQRIYPDVFWESEHPAVEWSLFPEARELKHHVLALPVHQDVNRRQLERLVRVLRER
jgi:dTDP-4-amino-4,6-dideoxygalactose transaminase